MPVFDGFGVNYKAKQSNWAADIAYFKSIGLKSIRPNMAGVPIPWSAGIPRATGSFEDINAYWRLCAQTFANAGFWVTWGVTSGGLLTITASNWQQYHDAVVAEAAYLQQQGIVLGDFEIANETEKHIDGTTMTLAQLNENFRQLARDVKEVYTLGPVSKGCQAEYANILDWTTNGLGGLDSISLHTYGTILPATSTVNLNAFIWIDRAVETLGPACYVSEFNLDSHSDNIVHLSDSTAIAIMRSILDTYLIGHVRRALVYNWVGYLNRDNQFAQLYTSGAMNPMWFEFFTADPQFYVKRASAVERSAALVRPISADRSVSNTRNLDA